MPKPLRLGYHLDGLPNHDVGASIECVAAIGFTAIVYSPRRCDLIDSAATSDDRDRGLKLMQRLGEACRRASLRLAVDLNGRFVADARIRRWPSLASDDLDEACLAEQLATTWIDWAGAGQADCVYFSSGSVATAWQPDEASADNEWAVKPSLNPETSQACLDRLATRVNRLVTVADAHSVRISLCPRCGHEVATVGQFERLQQWLSRPEGLGLTADVDSMVQAGEMPIADRLVRNIDRLDYVCLTEHIRRTSGDPVARTETSSSSIDVRRLSRSLAAGGFDGHWMVRATGDVALGPDDARSVFGRISVAT